MAVIVVIVIGMLAVPAASIFFPTDRAGAVALRYSTLYDSRPSRRTLHVLIVALDGGGAAGAAQSSGIAAASPDVLMPKPTILPVE